MKPKTKKYKNKKTKKKDPQKCHVNFFIYLENEIDAVWIEQKYFHNHFVSHAKKYVLFTKKKTHSNVSTSQQKSVSSKERNLPKQQHQK